MVQVNGWRDAPREIAGSFQKAYPDDIGRLGSIAITPPSRCSCYGYGRNPAMLCAFHSAIAKHFSRTTGSTGMANWAGAIVFLFLFAEMPRFENARLNTLGPVHPAPGNRVGICAAITGVAAVGEAVSFHVDCEGQHGQRSCRQVLPANHEILDFHLSFTSIVFSSLTSADEAPTMMVTLPGSTTKQCLPACQ